MKTLFDGEKAFKHARAPRGIDIMMHSAEDIIEYISPKALGDQGKFIETWMTRYVTGAAAFPFEKEIPEKLMKEFKEYYKNWHEPLP